MQGRSEVTDGNDQQRVWRHTQVREMPWDASGCEYTHRALGCGDRDNCLMNIHDIHGAGAAEVTGQAY